MIVQGDAYSIPITIKINGTLVKGSDVTKMIIKIGNISKSTDDGEVTYDNTNNKWYFPLTAQDSRSFVGNQVIQAEWWVGANTKYNTPPVKIDVQSSIITTEDEE